MITQLPGGEESSASDAVVRQTREARALAEIGRVVGESERLEELYETIDASVRDLVPAERVVIALVHRGTGELRREFASGIRRNRKRTELQGKPLRSGILQKVRETGKASKIDDIKAVEDRYPAVRRLILAGVKSGIYAPLSVRGAVIGVLGVYGCRPGPSL